MLFVEEKHVMHVSMGIAGYSSPVQIYTADVDYKMKRCHRIWVMFSRCECCVSRLIIFSSSPSRDCFRHWALVGWTGEWQPPPWTGRVLAHMLSLPCALSPRYSADNAWTWPFIPAPWPEIALGLEQCMAIFTCTLARDCVRLRAV